MPALATEYLSLAKPLETSYVGLVGQAIVVSLAFIPPPNGVPFWWGHSAVLGKIRRLMGIRDDLINDLRREQFSKSPKPVRVQ